MHPNAFLQSFWRSSRLPQVFVAMSFAKEYDRRFENVIKPAVEQQDAKDGHLEAKRVDNSKTGDSILTEIVEGIAHSHLVLADVSTVGRDSKTGRGYRNGNVMYEVGLALACRQPAEVLLIRDDHDPFLFDVSSIPHITIDFTDETEAVTKLSQELSARLNEINMINDARVSINLMRLDQYEIEVLMKYSGLGPSVELRTIYHQMAYGRLADKGAIVIRHFGNKVKIEITSMGLEMARRLGMSTT